jgi:hypothetical protein
VDGEKVFHGANGTSGRRSWCSRDDNCHAATEGIGLGSGDSELHVLVTSVFKKPNAVARKVDSGIKLRAVTDSKLSAPQESGPGQILSGIEDSVVDVGQITGDKPETDEDVESDGEFGFAVTVTLEALDTPNDPLQCWGVTDFERKACIDVEGTNGGEVAFNGFVLTGSRFASKMGGPGHEPDLGRGKELAGSGAVLGVEPNEIEEGSLGRGVRLPSGGSEPVPEEKRDFSREVSMRRIPLVRNCGVEDVRQSCGASWKRWLY